MKATWLLIAVFTAACDHDLVLSPVSELEPPVSSDATLVASKAPPELTPFLIGPGAEVANPDDWPASFFSEANKDCSSALVGPRALLIAAHCVKDKGLVFIKTKNAEGPCTQAPGFKANPQDRTADWALCRIDDPPNGLLGIRYERIDTPATELQVGGELLLTGFGCSEHVGTPDHLYRIGRATIRSLPTTDNFLRLNGPPALCLGDSGGPAFRLVNGNLTGPRRVAGVNSVENQNQVAEVASVTTPGAIDFFTDWARDNKVGMCGLPPGQGVPAEPAGCRN